MLVLPLPYDLKAKSPLIGFFVFQITLLFLDPVYHRLAVLNLMWIKKQNAVRWNENVLSYLLNHTLLISKSSPPTYEREYVSGNT